MIIDSSYFTKGLTKVQDATVPATEEGATLASLKPDAMAVNDLLMGYIEQYQHRFLSKLFGESLATEFEEYAEQTEEHDPAKEDMLSRVKPALACYVLYYFLRGTSQQSTAIGVTAFENANKKVSPASRQAAVWNEMVDRLRELHLWARANSTFVVNYDRSLFTKIGEVWL